MNFIPINTASNYSKEYIKNLYSAGLVDQLTFNKTAQNKEINKTLRHVIISDIKKNKFDKTKFYLEIELLNLFKLFCFIQAWADLEENWVNDVDNEYRKKRQQLKFKKNIDKPVRRLIHLSLFKLVYEALWRFKEIAINTENTEEIALINRFLGMLEYTTTEINETKQFKKKVLINSIKEFLEYKKFSLPYETIEKTFLDATMLITSYERWPDKLSYGCGLIMGLMASLACGLSTGGAIFVLLMGFSWPLGVVIPLSLLIFLAGTKANFQLFSQHIPQFFQDLWKNGRMTQFIDQQGNRLQLSLSKKVLLLPAGFFSLSVGIVAGAITYLEGSKMLALICPALAATCPHLAVVLLGLLASALLVSLSIVMFRTFTDVLKFKLSWQVIKQNMIEKWKNINWTHGLNDVLKVLVMGAALFGLIYLDFTGTATLAGLLGWVTADLITLAAILGDLPFTLNTALDGYNSLFKSNVSLNFTKGRVYYLKKIMEFFALIINAFGNAVLVFTDSCFSRIASAACFMNSYASNCVQGNNSNLISARAKATEGALLSCTFFRRSSLEVQAPAINDTMVLPKMGNTLHLNL